MNEKLLWLRKSELERINRLQWWEQVTGIEEFPKELNPWHFHAVGLIGNFINFTNKQGFFNCLIRTWMI